ncbi:MAG: uroporphyrinogen decarboxylase family protein [Lentisphaerae bacterium]|nr:uroporphyrinogen decarboxylase family protein [Lentisphaerota bacterium]
MSMTSRERWLALFNRQKPDRIPTDYWATNEVTERLQRELGCPTLRDLCNKLHIDRPDVIGANRTVTKHPVIPDADIWGMRYRPVDYGTGKYHEFAFHPLAEMTEVEQIHAFQWPSPDDHDFEAARRQFAEHDGRFPLLCGYYEPFLRYCAMRGIEQSMIDLVAEPDIADAILQHLFDYHYRLNARLFELGQGRIDLTFVAEDLGGQASLLMSLDHIRRFILPNQKKMADLARSFGIHIHYHTDGAARAVIPDLIQVTGIETLNPIQWRCPGMEREGLVRDFGDKIIFHGAVDNQQTLPFGTPADVRQEVLDNLRIFAWPARWICAPCHNLQPISPTANILALYETIWEEGRL